MKLNEKGKQKIKKAGVPSRYEARKTVFLSNLGEICVSVCVKVEGGWCEIFMSAAFEFLVSGTLRLFVCVLYAPWAHLRRCAQRPHYYYYYYYYYSRSLTLGLTEGTLRVWILSSGYLNFSIDGTPLCHRRIQKYSQFEFASYWLSITTLCRPRDWGGGGYEWV